MPDEVVEKIVVKPSIDLIPDEYDIPGKIAVHTFSSNTEDENERADLFKRTLSGDCYVVEEKTHCLDTENVYSLLDNIKSNVEGLSGLILFFSYYCKDDGMINIFDGNNIESIPIQDVIQKFTSYTCSGLKNKPKIFIFHVKIPPPILQTDSMPRGSVYQVTYDTPGEADMLIVYKKSESSSSSDFTQKLCDNIKDYGNVEDIVSLVTCLDSSQDDSRPLVVSTLTRKFYLVPSEHRGHHFHINQHQEEITKHLEDIKGNLSKMSVKAKVKTTATKNSKGTPSVPQKKPTNKTVSMTESDGASSSRNSVGTRGSRNPLTSLGTGGTSVRRNRLASTRSEASLSDKNGIDGRPRWR